MSSNGTDAAQDAAAAGAPINLTSASKHTPGPWHSCRKGECPCMFVWCDDHPVARVECGEWGDEYPNIRIVGESLEAKAEPFIDRIAYGSVAEGTAAANARLISAAPELLEALQACAKWMEETRACGDCGNWEWSEDSEYNKALAAIAKAVGQGGPKGSAEGASVPTPVGGAVSPDPIDGGKVG
jgi:hypothetical protein